MNATAPEPTQELLRHTLEFCNACVERGDLPAAYAALNRAHQLAPRDPEILSQRGRIALLRREFDKAGADFTAALRLDERCVLAHSGLARFHFEQGRLDQAQAAAQRALELDPLDEDARDVLAELPQPPASRAPAYGTRDFGLRPAAFQTAPAPSVPSAADAPVLPAPEAAQRSARAALDLFHANASAELAEVVPPALQDVHLQNSRIVPSREDILRLLPKGGVCAEVGTQTGGFAKLILSLLQPSKLHLFDTDYTPFEYAAFEPAIQQGTVVLHQGDSAALLAQLPDRSFDFIYIDGDHSYAGAVKDLEQAARKIKEDGWIVCNDYTLYSPLEKTTYGVYRAVNEFCLQHDYEICYLGLHFWAYHDVALRQRKSPRRNGSLALPSNHAAEVRINGKSVPLPGSIPAGSAAKPAPAKPAGVCQDIAPDDEMFTGDRAHYFGVGQSAMHCINTAMFAANKPAAEIRRVLDLPCGHGRVMRHLKAAFPQAHFTACDLNRSAVDFCGRTFGAETVYSQVQPRAIPLRGNFDLIWCGSLLTHLKEDPCAEFVRAFQSLLAPGGLAIFTLHGRWVERSLATGRYKYGLRDDQVKALLHDYYETGFGYSDYPGVSGYGITLCNPAFTLGRLAALPDLKLITYHEKGWDNHQDLVCVQKQSVSELLA